MANIIAIAYLVFMWVKKDIAEIYATMSEEQFVPLVAATIAVSLLKIAAIAGEWIVIKSKSK